METIWTASAEAILAEQSWSRSERERHQRVLHQLKLELQQEQRQRHKAVVAATEMAPPAPTDDVTATQPESAESARKERLFQHPKKSLPPVQIL